MSEITTVGLDLAKNVFHLVACDRRGKVLLRKKLTRAKLMAFFAQLPPCLVGIEACATGHFWARKLGELGHDVRQIPAQHVKAFLRGNKNDYNDALAIAEAVVRPEMRFVATKTQEQQDRQSLNRYRQCLISKRTGEANRVRALLAESGIILAKELATLRRNLPILLENRESQFSDTLLMLLQMGYQNLVQLDDQIKRCDQQLKRTTVREPDCCRLLEIPGFGPIVASAFVSHVGDGSGFRRGRDVAASIGVVPKQHSSGGREVLLGISKRGDKMLRALVIHGARSAVSHVGDKQDPISCWIRSTVARVGKHKAIVAYANKMARIGWSVLRHQTRFDPAFVVARSA